MNVSEEYREVSCPIVRDDFLGNGRIGFAIYVRGATEDDFCCSIYNFSENGSTVIDSYTHCFNTAGYAVIYNVNPIIDNVEGGYYGLSCNVPPNSWVMQYQIMERLPTDEEDSEWIIFGE